MAHELKLDVITIKIKRKGKNELLGFKNFYQETEDDSLPRKGFITFFKKYIESFGDDFAADKEIGKAINLNTSNVKIHSRLDLICGTIEGGTTGIGGLIKSRKNASGNSVYKVTRDKVTVMPYYFMIWIPKNSDVGLLILQSYGSRSIGDVYKAHLKRFFSKSCNDSVLVTGSHVPKAALDKINSESQVDEIIMRRYHLPSTKGEKLLGIKYQNDRNITIEIKIKGLKTLPEIASKVQDFIEGKITQLIDVEDLDEIGFNEKVETSIVLEHNGKKATGKMKQEFKISPAYYIEKGDVKVNDLHHPEFDSIHSYCLTFLEAMKAEIGYKTT